MSWKQGVSRVKRGTRKEAGRLSAFRSSEFRVGGVNAEMIADAMVFFPRSAFRVWSAPGFPGAPRFRADGRKPDSVPGARAPGDDHFSPPAREGRKVGGTSRSQRRRGDYYPEAAPPKRSRPGAGPPVMSCTAEGFSCPAHCCAGGGLLPRLFTLARRLRAGRSVFCDTVCRAGLSPVAPADSPRPAAWWCPDFPLAGEPRAIIGHPVVSVSSVLLRARLRCRKIAAGAGLGASARAIFQP